MLKLKLQYFGHWCEELTHLIRPWCLKRLKVGGEGDDRGWDGWMASLPQWTWVWVNSASWWWTGKLVVLQSMGSQRVRRLSNWTELYWYVNCLSIQLGKAVSFIYLLVNIFCLFWVYRRIHFWDVVSLKWIELYFPKDFNWSFSMFRLFWNSEWVIWGRV